MIKESSKNNDDGYDIMGYIKQVKETNRNLKFNFHKNYKKQ